jgi:hypothetical protein
MQVLSDAQWAKFEAAIEAAEIRGARRRREIGAQSRRSSGGSTMARSGVRSRPNLAVGTTPTCGSADGRSVVFGTRSWPTSSSRESRNWHSPASTGRSRARTRRHPGHGPARLAPKPWIESAIHSRHCQQRRGAGPFAWWSRHQDRRHLRRGRATGRLPADAGPGPRACAVVDTAAAIAQGAVLGDCGHGMRRGAIPRRSTRPGRHPRRALAPRNEGATAVPGLYLSPPEPDRTQRWLTLSEHRFAFYKWKLCRVGL